MPARFRSNRAALEARFYRASQEAVARSAFALQAEIKRQLNKGASPPASRPGTPPHRLTGQLGQSIATDLRGLNRRNPSARVGTSTVKVPYARVHEYGHPGITPKKGKYLRFKTSDGKWHAVTKVVMPARPYIRPSVALAMPKIRAAFAAAYRRIGR